jgi:hypothetical protein
MFPKREFEKALAIQSAMDLLVHRISMDYDFLQSTLKAYVSMNWTYPVQFRKYTLYRPQDKHAVSYPGVPKFCGES